jgi:D-amino-acid dehydrogenase
MWAWLLQMLGNCTHARFARNHERMLRLARYSHDCLIELRAATGVEYDASTRGLLTLYRDRRSFEGSRRALDALIRVGVPVQALDRAGCLAHEPALEQTRAPIAGGMYFPADESGDCRAFTRALAARAAADGVRFLASTTVERLIASGDRVDTVVTSGGRLSADHYVAACGSYTPPLLRPIGIRLPVYPVKGYSLTIPIDDARAAPLATVTDETYKVVVTRLGGRLRVAGTAELAGYDLRLRPSRLATLAHVVGDLFPRAGDPARAEPWCGLRPMTPDNPPVLGPTRYRNLSLNTGHGTLGWTMACGSAKALAAIVSGRRPEIAIDDLTLARFE